MTLLESTELRWFLTEGSPAVTTLLAWFHDVPVHGARSDLYVRTGRSDLGIKLRREEGFATRLETKFLVGSLGDVTVAPRIAGNLERWRKLSMTTTDDLDVGAEHIEIEKERRLRKYTFDGARATCVPGEARVDVGVGVELTHLRVRNRGIVAWTFGLEAFGRQELQLDALLATCREVFAGGALELRATDSCSYPSWLATLDA